MSMTREEVAQRCADTADEMESAFHAWDQVDQAETIYLDAGDAYHRAYCIYESWRDVLDAIASGVEPTVAVLRREVQP